MSTHHLTKKSEMLENLKMSLPLVIIFVILYYVTVPIIKILTVLFLIKLICNCFTK